jgi:NUDIX domain-containing protein
MAKQNLAHISKKNKVIEILSRKKIHKAGLLHRESDCLIINHNGVLLHKTESSNKWGHFNGDVDYREQYKDAALRIFREATKFHLTAKHIKKVAEYQRCVTTGDGINNRWAKVYLSILPIREKSLKEKITEDMEIKYFSRIELLDLLMDNKKILGSTKYLLTKIPIFLYNCVP